MNTDMHGSSIATICFGPDDAPTQIHAAGKKTLRLSATYHGDRDEFWVIECDDGKEIARHNCKNIGTIIWSPAP